MNNLTKIRFAVEDAIKSGLPVRCWTTKIGDMSFRSSTMEKLCEDGTLLVRPSGRLMYFSHGKPIMAIIKGIAEHDDPSAYFGATGNLANFCRRAIDDGFLDEENNLTAYGRSFYNKHLANFPAAEPLKMFDRYTSWNWRALSLPASEDPDVSRAELHHLHEISMNIFTLSSLIRHDVQGRISGKEGGLLFELIDSIRQSLRPIPGSRNPKEVRVAIDHYVSIINNLHCLAEKSWKEAQTYFQMEDDGWRRFLLLVNAIKSGADLTKKEILTVGAEMLRTDEQAEDQQLNADGSSKLTA